jgi:hypothetical protein
MGRRNLILDYRLLSWLVWAALATSPACGPSGEDDTSSSGGDASVGGSASGGDGPGAGGAPGGGGSAAGGASPDGGTSNGAASSGGAESGGADSGGAPSGGGRVGTGGAGAGGGCVESTEPRAPGRARSHGFSGTDSDYSKLYDDPCSVPSDCVAPCVERGGTTEFCSTSICQESDTDYCLPPTKWRGVDGALSESGTIESSAVTSLSLSNGNDHDRLIVDDFGFAIPDDATILGISATIHRAAGGPQEASDHAVRIIKNGAIGETKREKQGYWPTTVTPEDYGGETDLWGETWTPADINAESFGLAIAALPAKGAGRAYVDVAYLRVHYQLPSCDE